MSDLNLNFLDKDNPQNGNTIFDILKKYAEQICKYADGFFLYDIVSVKENNKIKFINLYINAPEINYEYIMIKIEYINLYTIKITATNLISANNEVVSLNIGSGLETAEEKIKLFIENEKTTTSLKILVDQTLLHREEREMNGE